MNDRFKFRVWNKKYNCYDFCKRKFGILYIQEKFRVSSGYDGEDHPTFCEDVNENYIIEQCTGLKDKNDKLIYEGDIIKYCVNWRNYVLTYTRIVAWDDNTCGFVVLNSKTQVKPLQKWRFPDPNTHIIEIVGNVHKTKKD